MILLAFSIPPLTPIAMMSSAASRPTICHALLPIVKIPPSSIMRTASDRESAPGAAASKLPPMVPMSVPIANSCPEMPMKQYLKIQPITTV